MSDIVNRFIHKYSRLPTETDPDYLEMLRMSKYRILDVPDFSPGKCANCGSSKNDRRKYIDFGLQVDWYGTVYLCGNCIHDIADAMGMFDVLKLELKEVVNRGAEIEELHRKGERLHEVIIKTHQEFEEFYGNVPVDRQPDLVDVPNDSSDSSTEETTSESGTNENESGIVKPTSSSRSKNVRSLTDLLNDS